MPRGFGNMHGQQGWSIDRKLEILIKGYPAEAARREITLDGIPAMSQSEKFDARNALRDYAQQHWSAKWYTTKAVFAEALYQTGGIGRHHVNSAYAHIMGFLNQPDETDGPFVLTKNPEQRGGSRVPLNWTDLDDRGDCLIEKKARAQFSAVKDEVAQRLTKERDNQKLEDNLNDHELDLEDQESGDEDEQQGDIEEMNREQESLGKQADEFWNKYAEIREWTLTRDVGGHQIDTLERRPYIAAAKMIAAGIPNRAIFHAMTMHWSPTNRAENGIEDYDVREFKKGVDRPAGMPPEFHYLRALVDMRIWPWLISPAGVGKTTIVEKFAVLDGMNWCAIPLNRGTSPSAFNGRPKITNTSVLIRFIKAMSEQDEETMVKIAREAERDGDVTISEFVKILNSGGHVLFDEIDAGDENLLMMANMPLANGRFANTATGSTVEVHPDTIFWAASNTMGLGVTAGQGREYRGRNALDFATIDRFRMGRVKMVGDIEDYRKHFSQLVLAYQG